MKESQKGGRSKKAPARAARKTKRAPTKAKRAAKVERQAGTPAPKKPARRAPTSAAASLEKITALCLALPDTKLTLTWGSPHFRVADKIFCGYGDEDGKPVMGLKLTMGHARAVVAEPRFWPAKYVGKHGWVSMDVSQRKSWDEVAALIRESYELIAPKASREKLR